MAQWMGTHTQRLIHVRILTSLQYAILRYFRSRLWYLSPRTSRTETGLSRLVRLRTRAYDAVVPQQLQSLDHRETQLQSGYPVHVKTNVLTVSRAWRPRA